VSKGRFAPRIRALSGGQAMLERVIEPMLRHARRCAPSTTPCTERCWASSARTRPAAG
jgi:hypothetical protein